MAFSPAQIQALEAPLSGSHVKSREQAGRTLSYVEAWHAIAEANRIFGFGAWDRETVDLRQLGDIRIVGDKCRVGYSARVRITVRAGGDTIVREGCGFGSGIDKDADQAHESALKEAESDAMKRALMTFGNPFGLALYDKTQANVEGPVAASGRQAPAARQQAAAAPAPAPPRPTLSQRAASLEEALKASAHDPAKLKRTFELGAGLCAELDAKDPERLAEVVALYERLQLTPEEVFA